MPHSCNTRPTRGRKKVAAQSSSSRAPAPLSRPDLFFALPSPRAAVVKQRSKTHREASLRCARATKVQRERRSERRGCRETEGGGDIDALPSRGTTNVARLGTPGGTGLQLTCRGRARGARTLDPSEREEGSPIHATGQRQKAPPVALAIADGPRRTRGSGTCSMRSIRTLAPRSPWLLAC